MTTMASVERFEGRVCDFVGLCEGKSFLSLLRSLFLSQSEEWLAILEASRIVTSANVVEAKGFDKRWL